MLLKWLQNHRMMVICLYGDTGLALLCSAWPGLAWHGLAWRAGERVKEGGLVGLKE